jgi:hypothetical protein
VYEQVDGAAVAVVRCPVQRTALLVTSRCEVGAAGDEQPHDIAAAPVRCHVKRCPPAVASDVDVDAARNEQIGSIHTVVASCEVKGAAPTAVPGVDAYAAADGQLHHRNVTASSCVMQHRPLASLLSASHIGAQVDVGCQRVHVAHSRCLPPRHAATRAQVVKGGERLQLESSRVAAGGISSVKVKAAFQNAGE